MTVRQKQCLLAYLGYYNGDVDGIWGDRSRDATAAFQEKSGLKADGIFGEKTEAAILAAIAQPRESFWDSIHYFTRQEFACKCGTSCDGFPAEPERQLVELADAVRAHFGAPIRVSSGVRCPKHNANVGGVSNSRHLSGKAMDFRVEGKSSAQVLPYVLSLPGVRYAYAIDGNYLHMDIT